jgi:transmembrane sensor
LLAVAAMVFGVALTLLSTRAPAPADLHLTDGSDVPPHIEARGPLVTLDDGSRLTLRPGTRLDLLESTARAFALALRGGTADFDVRPGGPRLWRIECGPVTVEVVGTRFTVARDEAHVVVSVERGAVLVSGLPVPDRVVRLGPNQSIVIPLARAAAGAPAKAPEEAGVAGEATPVASGAAVGPNPMHQGQEVRPRSVAPVPSAVPSTTPPPADSVESRPPQDLETFLARADEARLAGRYQEAADILERVVREHTADPRAGIAEFSLGRLYLDSMGTPAPAAVHFSRALMHGLSDALAEDAYARLVESYARSGDSRAARDVADRYRAHFPRGRLLESVNRWSSSTP